MKMEPKFGKRVLARSAWSLLVIFFLGAALSGLTGCGKSCDKLDSELGPYIQGGVQSADKDKLLKQCEDAMAKCPNLSSPYEVMGDLKAKENRPKEAIEHYRKALALAVSKERIQNKIDKNETLIDEQARKETVEATNEAEKDRETAIKRVAGTKMSEYQNLDESIRLAWCEGEVNKKKESLEKRTSSSKTGKPFILHADAKYLDEKLMALSKGKFVPTSQVYDMAVDILEKRTDQSVD